MDLNDTFVIRNDRTKGVISYLVSYHVLLGKNSRSVNRQWDSEMTTATPFTFNAARKIRTLFKDDESDSNIKYTIL